mgnify:CR=1 FL=1
MFKLDRQATKAGHVSARAEILDRLQDGLGSTRMAFDRHKVQERSYNYLDALSDAVESDVKAAIRFLRPHLRSADCPLEKTDEDQKEV